MNTKTGQDRLSPEVRSLLAQRLAGQTRSREVSAGYARLARRGSGSRFPLSFAQERLWFLEQLEGPSALYNSTHTFRMRGDLDAAAMAEACRELVARHEILRTTFESDDGTPVQVIHAPEDLPAIDGHWGQDASSAEIEAFVQAVAREPFDLVRGPLFRVQLWRRSDGAGASAACEHLFLVQLHHIVMDAWSIGVLIQDLAALYRSALTGRTSHSVKLRSG